MAVRSPGASRPTTSAASLKNLLLYTCMHPLYLSTTEGQRFIAHVISLHVPFFDEIYATLRNQAKHWRRTGMRASFCRLTAIEACALA